ncbi:MAG: hypothetical protein KBE22_00265 [Candidatus Accumulibacter sp.]|nr:hypothetical protein [Accumulibacter sp.]
MNISYAGDLTMATHFTGMAQQEFFALRSLAASGGGPRRTTKTFTNPFGTAIVDFQVGGGNDRIHITARLNPSIPVEEQGVPIIFSGAVLDSGKITSGSVIYAPTFNTSDRFGFVSTPITSQRLAVKRHASMPACETDPTDSQNATQQPSKYTGGMCRLVQVILGYGRLKSDSAFTKVVKAFRDEYGAPLDLPPSVLWTEANIANGVQNTFGYMWSRTTGLFTRYYLDEDDVPRKQLWLVELNKDSGFHTMPLQIEPVTALPQFRQYLVDEILKPGHKQYLNDMLAIVDEFGGFPSNEAFYSTEDHIRDQIAVQTERGGGSVEDGSFSDFVIPGGHRGVSEDHGWAFNSDGTRASLIALINNGTVEAPRWWSAHIQYGIRYDSELGRPVGQQVLSGDLDSSDGGYAPIQKHRLKVSSTTLGKCVSYNLDWPDDIDMSGQQKATKTPMFSFWKNDRLIVLRWTVGHTDDVSRLEESGDSWHYSSDTWVGRSGSPPAFFCDLGANPTIEIIASHTHYESHQYVANEHSRSIGYLPSSDSARWWNRRHWAWRDRTWLIKTGQTTNNCCAFTPVGDRSAFYTVAMVTRPQVVDKSEPSVFTLGDPYGYQAAETYIWNWDLGKRYGDKYPVTYNGLTVDGIYYVRWDRNGGAGRAQLEWYGQIYNVGPEISPDIPELRKEWTDRTGLGEWDNNPGSEPEPMAPTIFGGNPKEAKNEITPAKTEIIVHMVSMQNTGKVFSDSGSYSYIVAKYNYWFAESPDGDAYQTLWAFKNTFGDRRYQLFSGDVNDRDLRRVGGYGVSTDLWGFPTFIGVVGGIPPEGSIL